MLGRAPQNAPTEPGEARSWARAGGAQLDAIARSLSPYGAPVVVFGAAHSGGALTSRLLGRLGVFMGSDLDEGEESPEIVDLIRYLAETHAPDFARLLEDGDANLPRRVRLAFQAHLAERPGGQRWGWKLPQTGYVLPVIARLFPDAWFVHVVRDGRDVAFTPSGVPRTPLWRGLAMVQRIDGHIAAARRWASCATLARAHGMMLGDRYVEVRYEALAADPAGELTRLAAFLGLGGPRAAHETMDVYATSVGKWRERPQREIVEARAALEPALAAFGYRWDGSSASGSGLSGRGVSAERRAQPGGLGGLFRVRGKR